MVTKLPDPPAPPAPAPSRLAAPAPATTNAVPAAARSHRRPPAPVLLLLALGLAAGGWWGWQHLAGPPDDGRLRASGTIESDDVSIAAELSARIVAIPVQEGDLVRRGQVLIQLDDAMQQLEYRQAQGPEVQRLELQIEKLKVRAPADGRIGERSARPGELAAAGATLLTLTPLDELRLTIYVLERDLGRVRLGQTVALTADPYPGEQFTGRVTSVANRAEFTPRNVQTPKDRVNLVFAVRIRVPNPDDRLRPGLPVDAVFLDE